jgi:hypothetical protein
MGFGPSLPDSLNSRGDLHATRGACLYPPRVANMGFSIHTKSVFRLISLPVPKSESGFELRAWNALD